MSIVMVTALFSAIAIYVVMFIVISQARQAGFYRYRTRARYAAEAGIVWAQQKLLVDSNFSSPAGNVDFTTTDGINVDVILPVCATPPCQSRSLQAKVDF